MFALEVEYLAGRSVATARHDRELAEWPPHPGRLFCALVAACHESDLTADEREAGRNALCWLEQQDSPAISVSEASARDIISVFVPVNDVKSPDLKPDRVPSAGQIVSALEVLPERRPKQPRFFPSVTPARPVLH